MKNSKAFNQAVMQRAHDNADMHFLASPVTGRDVHVGRFQQLFCLALQEGRKQPDDWAQFTWQALSSLGQRIVRNSTTIESPEENLAELKSLATTFAEKQLPVLRTLGIVARP